MEDITFAGRFTEGVYGPNARVNNAFNGGPECAAQVPLYFIISTILLMVSEMNFHRGNPIC